MTTNCTGNEAIQSTNTPAQPEDAMFVAEVAQRFAAPGGISVEALMS